MALTSENCKALNVGEFRLTYPLTPAGPTFFGQPLRKFPECFLPNRFFATFYEMIRPPVTTFAFPQLRTLLAGLLTGNPSKFDTTKVQQVSFSS